MFRSPQDYRSFLTLLFTYVLDITGYTIAFPVLAPLFLNPKLHFFASEASIGTRTMTLGLLFALFGIANVIAGPFLGALADYYGRKKIFLVSIGLSVLGYAGLAIGVYKESLTWMFIGRGISGFGSGNSGLAQSVTADLTDTKHRGKAVGILQGMSGFGFVIGPFIGGKLSNPQWVHGSGAFIFAAIAALCNFFIMFFFFSETWKRISEKKQMGLFTSFLDIRVALQQKILRNLLITYLLFSTGRGVFQTFSPTFLVQKFALGPDKIGDIFAYMAVFWIFFSIFLNKELVGKFSLVMLIRTGTISIAAGVILFLWPSHLWPYWIIIPIIQFGGVLGAVNLTTLFSTNASEEMRGKILGTWQSSFFLGQIIASSVSGVLAGWNLYLPLSFGGLVFMLGFIYFSRQRKLYEKTYVDSQE